MPDPIGHLLGPPPYRAWRLRAGRDWPWGIQNGSGWNCVGGLGGNTFLPSPEFAEAMIRSHGFEPEEPADG